MKKKNFEKEESVDSIEAEEENKISPLSWILSIIALCFSIAALTINIWKWCQ